MNRPSKAQYGMHYGTDLTDLIQVFKTKYPTGFSGEREKNALPVSVKA